MSRNKCSVQSFEHCLNSRVEICDAMWQVFEGLVSNVVDILRNVLLALHSAGGWWFPQAAGAKIIRWSRIIGSARKNKYVDDDDWCFAHVLWDLPFCWMRIWAEVSRWWTRKLTSWSRTIPTVADHFNRSWNSPCRFTSRHFQEFWYNDKNDVVYSSLAVEQIPAQSFRVSTIAMFCSSTNLVGSLVPNSQGWNLSSMVGLPCFSGGIHSAVIVTAYPGDSRFSEDVVEEDEKLLICI